MSVKSGMSGASLKQTRLWIWYCAFLRRIQAASELFNHGGKEVGSEERGGHRRLQRPDDSSPGPLGGARPADGSKSIRLIAPLPLDAHAIVVMCQAHSPVSGWDSISFHLPIPSIPGS